MPMRWMAALLALVMAGMLWSSGVRAAEPYGAIGEKYVALGGRGGALGPAIGNESAAPHGGRFHLFQNGVIYWHPETGAFAVWGAISVKYWELGRAEYGYPITDERVTPDRRGRYNHFRAVQIPGKPESSIYWTPETGAHAIYGGIRDAWARAGWERGELGYPTSDEFDTGGGSRRQDFERGYIAWTPQGGARIVKSGSGVRTAPQTFGSHLVRGMEVSVAGRRIDGNPNFLSENAICGAFNAARPALEERAESELFNRVAPRMRPFGLHPEGTKMHLSPGCSFRAEVAQVCSNRAVKLRIVLPRNVLRFQVTTPSAAGIGLGEYADPKLSVDFDVAAETNILLPRDASGSLRLDVTRVTISNVRPGSQSPTGDIALAVAEVIDYVSEAGLFAELAKTHIFRLPGLEQPLTDLSPAVRMIPPSFRVDACVDASDVLTLNGTNAPEDRGPIVN